MFTDKERETLRHIQDRLIVKLERCGYTDNSIVIELDKITLRNLKDMIYPVYRDLFIDYLEEN